MKYQNLQNNKSIAKEHGRFYTKLILETCVLIMCKPAQTLCCIILLCLLVLFACKLSLQTCVLTMCKVESPTIQTGRKARNKMVNMGIAQPPSEANSCHQKAVKRIQSVTREAPLQAQQGAGMEARPSSLGRRNSTNL